MSPTSVEIREGILRALGNVAPEVDPATLENNVSLREQIDLDSMDFLNCVIGVHEELGIDIPEVDYPKLSTLDGFVEYLARRMDS